MELVRTLSHQDRESLFGWDEQVFPVEGRNWSWAQPSHHIVYRKEGAATGHIGFLKSTVETDELLLHVIGVGGVVVRPESQGKGIPGKMFAFLHEIAPGETGTNLFTLFCPHRLLSYYAMHGYKEYQWPVRVTQGNELKEIDFGFMTFGKPEIKGPITTTSEPW